MRIRLYIRQAVVAGIVAILLHGAATSDSYTHFPGATTDQRTMEAQAMVEELYVAGKYERALIIYEKELAPIGDKYAQYMVGYMHQNGDGVEVNEPVALAWYRLAAERGESSITAARNELYATMSQEEVAESNEIFVDLWREYSDSQLIIDLIRNDLEILKERTGSRIVRSNTGAVSIVSMRSGESNDVAFYERVRKRMDMRISYLDANVEVVDIALNDDMEVRTSLEQEIREELANLDMR